MGMFINIVSPLPHNISSHLRLSIGEASIPRITSKYIDNPILISVPDYLI
jgi:hypothetical protein